MLLVLTANPLWIALPIFRSHPMDFRNKPTIQMIVMHEDHLLCMAYAQT